MRFSPTFIARCVFVAICLLLGFITVRQFGETGWHGGLGGLILGIFVVLMDSLLKNLSFRGFSHATFGLLVGLFCGFLIESIVQDLLRGPFGAPTDPFRDLIRVVTQLGIYVTFGFWGMSLAMRSNRQEFSFIIPYVRFRQESAQDSPLLVDTNVIIDGRIPSICSTGFLSGAVVVPHFVLDELHVLADSKDGIKSDRGKRGLECLNQMQTSKNLEVTIQEDYQAADLPVDTKLIHLALRLGARLLTNDSNLGKVAQLQGVTVLNLNQLAHAMRPVAFPGDSMILKLVREGKEEHQAVGYLEDGTMIVVNHAIQHLGDAVPIVLGSPLQTSAGRLIFAELDGHQYHAEISTARG